jgi:hypothetical protein
MVGNRLRALSYQAPTVMLQENLALSASLLSETGHFLWELSYQAPTVMLQENPALSASLLSETGHFLWELSYQAPTVMDRENPYLSLHSEPERLPKKVQECHQPHPLLHPTSCPQRYPPLSGYSARSWERKRRVKILVHSR